MKCRPRPPWLRLSVACLAAGSVSSIASDNSKRCRTSPFGHLMLILNDPLDATTFGTVNSTKLPMGEAQGVDGTLVEDSFPRY